MRYEYLKEVERVFIYILIVLSVGLFVNSIYQSTQFLNKNFPGFLVYNNQIVSQVSLKDWALNSGYDIKSYDKVTRVNGIEINNSRQLYEIVGEKAPGTYFTYNLLRSNTNIEVTLPSQKFTVSDYLQTALVQILTGFLIVITGLLVFRLKSQLITSKALLFLCLSIGNWFINDFDYQSTYSVFYGFNIAYFFQILTPACFIFLAFVFPEPKRIYKTKPFVFILPFIFSFLLFGAQFYYKQNPILWEYLDTIVWLSVIIGIFLFIFSLSWDYFKSKNLLFKKRAQVALLGSIAGFFTPAVLAFIFVISGYENISMLTIPVLFFPIALGYAIIKHKLFDIHVIVQKALVYGLSSGAVATIFIVPLFILNLRYSTENLLKNPIYLLFLSVAVILLVNPLQNLVQRFVDTLFFRKKYDYATTIAEFSDKLSSLLSISEISNELMHTLNMTMFVEKGHLFVIEKNTGSYELTSSIPIEDFNNEDNTFKTFDGSNTLVEFLYKNRKEIFVEDVISEDQYVQKRIDLLKTFADFKATLIIPLFFKSDLLGILILANKKSGQLFTSEDLNFIRTITNQVSISLENSFSFELVQDYANEVEEKNKQLKNVQAQLIQAEKMSAIGHLASGIAHEIRNPLNIIEGARYYLSSLFANGSENGVAHEYLEYIQNEVIRTNRLIDSLLDFSKFQESNIENININNVIENVLILSRKQLSDNNIKIKKNLDDKLPTLKGDSNQLWQVVINLLMNSVQAINSVRDKGGEGEIVVESGIYSKTETDFLDHLYLKVMDNGCGIKEKDLSSIFDPFYTNKPDGTGLGLSVSYKIVEAHSGSMLVTSEVGIGTSFMVELPVVNQFSGEVVNGQKENLNS